MHFEHKNIVLKLQIPFLISSARFIKNNKYVAITD